MKATEQLLFANRLYPITREFAFVEAPCHRVEQFAAWQQRIGQWRGIELVVQDLTGDLESALMRLLPFTAVENRRYLFVPTASTWTAYFDNGHRGSDPGPPVSFLAQHLKTRWVRVVADVGFSGSPGDKVRARELILEFHGPQARFGPILTDKRILDLTAGESGRWQFRQIGTPLPFERLERYAARRTPDRFDVALMQEYLLALGVQAFDDAFYMPDGVAHLVEKVGPRSPRDRDWSLEEVRKFWQDAGDWTAARSI
jgi:hypothetical protein